MIRKATENDASGIAEVHVAAWRNSYEGIVPSSFLESLSIEKRAEMWVRQTGNSESRIWISLKGDCVNGFLAGGGCRDDDLPRCDEIYAIYVSPSSQRQGLGRKLTEAFFAEGCDDCVLWVLEENRNAINFYRSLGFELEGRTKTVELGGKALSEVRYRKYGEQGVSANSTPGD